MSATDRPARAARLLAALAAAAALVAGCGGGGGGSSSEQAATSGPTVQQAVAVAAKNPGLAKCKKVSHGLLDNTPSSPQEPRVILSITCDGATVGLWERFRTPADALASGKALAYRPYLVNGTIKVETGSAVFAHIDAGKWKTFPDELAKACGCGKVFQPN